MKISIIIPTFNNVEALKQSVTLLEKASIIGLAEVLIVDNGSTDGTDLVVSRQSSVISQYIKLKHNYGFTRAINEGAKKAKGKYLLFLNNDCFVEKDTIASLYAFLEKNNNYVATQPIIQTQQGDVESIGYMVDLKKGKAEVVQDEDRILDWILRQAQDDKVSMWNTGQVYGLSATCLLIRKDIFMKVGMFDESFHSYLEDVDLFIRLAGSGYKYAPCIDVHVTHEHRATSKKMGAYKERHDMTNWIRIILKNYPQSFIFRHFLSLFIERLRNISGLMKALLS